MKCPEKRKLRFTDRSSSSELRSHDVDLDEETEIDLGEEEAAEEELDLGGEEEPQEEDESAIGISDLAPSEEVEETEEKAAQGSGLEALDVEGLDLDSAPEATDPDKITPSVKTGTALDDFEVDLGDLMSSKD